MKKKVFYAVILVLILILLFTRLYMVADKPLHHDEGVNGWFMNNLFYQGHYEYDPSNYHGPFFYFISLPSFFIFGSTVFSLRMTVVLFGILLFLVLFFLKNKYTKLSFLVVLLFLILSPSISYYSRYAIHEIMFIFFTLTFYIFLISYLDKKTPESLYLAAASLGFLFAIKETAYLLVFVFFTYFLISEIYNYKTKKQTPYLDLFIQNSKTFFYAFLIFIFIIFIFYSNFLHNLAGSFDIIKSLYFWIDTGTEGHIKPFYYFFVLLIKYELPILIFGILGIIYCVNNKKNLLLVWWALGILLIYSAIPYKTPWLLPNMVLPLVLLSGYGVIFLYKKNLEKILYVLLLISILFLAYQMIYVNYLYPEADEKNRFAYAHTTSDINWVMEKIRDSNYTKIAMIGEDGESYWPFPFYLHGKDILYGDPSQFGNLTDVDVLIMYKEFKEQLSEKDLELYEEHNFELRPNVKTKLFVKK